MYNKEKHKVTLNLKITTDPFYFIFNGLPTSLFKEHDTGYTV